MSASEKLKALGAEHDGATTGALALLGLPLPQIVAVVEAADTVCHRRDVNSIPALRDALTALDKALS